MARGAVRRGIGRDESRPYTDRRHDCMGNEVPHHPRPHPKMRLPVIVGARFIAPWSPTSRPTRCCTLLSPRSVGAMPCARPRPTPPILAPIDYARIITLQLMHGNLHRTVIIPLRHSQPGIVFTGKTVD